MGGCRCSFKNCKSATKNCDNIHFFHYPVKNRTRCKLWIENAEKPEFFNLPEDQLRNKVVCELHFESRCFCNASRKRLLHDAVPTLDIGCEEENKTTAEYDEQRLFSNVQVLPANSDGTIFTVDTDGLQQLCDSDEIDTYVYRNGVLTPVLKSETKYDCDNDTIVYAVSEEMVQGYESSNSVTEGLSHETSNDATNANNQSFQNSHENVFNINQSQENFIPVIKTEQNDYPIKGISMQQQGIICTEVEISSNEENSNASSNFPFLKQNTEANSVMKNPHKRKRQLQKRIMQKLNHHTQEISNIKRILKSNPSLLARKQKHNIALKVLKEKVPLTLYEVVLKTLKVNSTRKLKNIDFFKKLYLTSPKAYQLLQEQNWGVPKYFGDAKNNQEQSCKGTQTKSQMYTAQGSQTCSSEGQIAKEIQTTDCKSFLSDTESSNQSSPNLCSVGTQYFTDMVQQNTIGIQYLLDQNTVGTQCSFTIKYDGKSNSIAEEVTVMEVEHKSDEDDHLPVQDVE